MKLSKHFIDSESVFIHIPKSAGVSFSVGLYGIALGHHSAHEYYTNNKSQWNNLFSFTVVRNPLDRFLSAYNFLKNGGINKYDKKFCYNYKLNETNINIFIEKFFKEMNLKFIKPYIHFIPQHKFILHKRKRYSLISKIYKFENLESEYTSIINDIKLKNSKFNPLVKMLPSINKTKYNLAQQTYKDEITEDNIRKIKDFYYLDYQMFGYL